MLRILSRYTEETAEYQNSPLHPQIPWFCFRPPLFRAWRYPSNLQRLFRWEGRRVRVAPNHIFVRVIVGSLGVFASSCSRRRAEVVPACLALLVTHCSSFQFQTNNNSINYSDALKIKMISNLWEVCLFVSKEVGKENWPSLRSCMNAKNRKQTYFGSLYIMHLLLFQRIVLRHDRLRDSFQL